MEHVVLVFDLAPSVFSSGEFFLKLFMHRRKACPFQCLVWRLLPGSGAVWMRFRGAELMLEEALVASRSP